MNGDAHHAAEPTGEKLVTHFDKGVGVGFTRPAAKLGAALGFSLTVTLGRNDGERLSRPLGPTVCENRRVGAALGRGAFSVADATEVMRCAVNAAEREGSEK